MQGLEQITATLGTPSAVLAVAAALRYAGSAADKEGRPNALRDAARILADRSWSQSFRPSAVILEIFNRTYGRKQLSWLCLRRSILASLLFVLILSCAFSSVIGETLKLIGDIMSQNNESATLTGMEWVNAILFGVVPIAIFFVVGDYLSLWKSRIVVQAFDGKWPRFLLLVADLFLSLVLAFIVKVLIFECAVITLALHHQFTDMRDLRGQIFFVDADMSVLSLIEHSNSPTNINILIDDYFIGLRMLVVDGHLGIFSQILALSTLFPSLWAFLTLLAAAIVKILAPMQRFVTWFFDIEQHPFQAVGNVSAGLWLLGSLIWGVVRSIV